MQLKKVARGLLTRKSRASPSRVLSSPRYIDAQVLFAFNVLNTLGPLLPVLDTNVSYDVTRHFRVEYMRKERKTIEGPPLEALKCNPRIER
jgi:hypothetical protein